MNPMELFVAVTFLGYGIYVLINKKADVVFIRGSRDTLILEGKTAFLFGWSLVGGSILIGLKSLLNLFGITDDLSWLPTCGIAIIILGGFISMMIQRSINYRKSLDNPDTQEEDYRL